jgi:hypothetical protein
MPADRSDNTESPETLPYARKVERPWTRFQLSMAVACGIALLFLGLSTAELLYTIPGERYLFGERTDTFHPGLAAAVVSPIILVLSFFTRRLEVVIAAGCLVVLAIIWSVRLLVLLSYL